MAFCPECKQRALLTELSRRVGPARDDTSPTDRVTVTEHCQLCGHTGLLGLVISGGEEEDDTMPPPSSDPDNVLPFRSRERG